MSFTIRGLGTALPSTAITQVEALTVCEKICCQDKEQKEVLPGLYRQTAIATRHLAFSPEVVRDVLDQTTTSGSAFLPRANTEDHGPTTKVRMEHYKQEALPLALRAARQALEEAKLTARELTHLVTVSCTGFAAPGVDIGLIKQLGLSPTVERTHIGFMGCHGALNGLRAASAYCGARPAARVLLCAVELCSLHYHYGWNPKKLVANALFADGAAAAVGVPATESSPWRVAASGSCLFPDCEYAMTWDIGDHGFEMTLSTRVPDLIAQCLRPWIELWLGQQGLRVQDVRSWAIHPGGPRILSAVEETLGLDRDATAVSREVLADCGNMSSPTVLFVLERLRRRDAPCPCVALGFGPGLTAEAVLFL
jgi:predicted naringenin-chalcone synthase